MASRVQRARGGEGRSTTDYALDLMEEALTVLDGCDLSFETKAKLQSAIDSLSQTQPAR